MIGLTSKGSFKKTKDALNKFLKKEIFSDFHYYGRLGVDALASATPVDTGITANSWGYNIVRGPTPGIEWYNYNVVGGTPVVILLQYGHGTGTGGYVQGRDFINPAIQPVFDQIADEMWKKVTA